MKRSNFLWIQFAIGFLGVILFLLAFLLEFPMAMTIVLIVIYALFPCLQAYETFHYQGNKPIIRNVLSLIGWVFMILFFLAAASEENTLPYAEFMGVSAGMLVTAHLFVLIVTLIFQGKVSVTSTIETGQGKTLQLGNYSKKEEIGTAFATLFYILAIAGLIIGLMNIPGFPVVATIFIVLFFILVMFFALLIVKANIDNRPFLDFCKNLDLAAFEKVNEKRMKENLHPETRNYLHILNYYISIFFRPEQVEENQSKIFLPTETSYRIYYDIIGLEEALWRGVSIYDEEWQRLQVDPFYLKNPKLLRRFDKLQKVRALYDGTLDPAMLEATLPSEQKINLPIWKTYIIKY